MINLIYLPKQPFENRTGNSKIWKTENITCLTNHTLRYQMTLSERRYTSNMLELYIELEWVHPEARPLLSG